MSKWRILGGLVITIVLGMLLSSMAEEKHKSPAIGWGIAVGLFVSAYFLKWVSLRPVTPCSRPKAVLKFAKAYAIGAIIATVGIVLLRVWLGATNRMADHMEFFSVLIGVTAFCIAYPLYRLADKGPEVSRAPATAGASCDFRKERAS
jgi:hypothetical protein